MHYDELMTPMEEEGITEKAKEERLKELRDYIKSHNHLYDDHGSTIIGSREKSPKFQD